MVAKVKSHIPKRLRVTESGGFHQKLHRIDAHAACAVAGVNPDALALIKKARHIAQEHRQLWGEPIPISLLVRQVCNHKHGYTQHGGLRPYGVALLFSGWDQEKGFQVYQTDPSGSFDTGSCPQGESRCRSIATIGGGSDALRRDFEGRMLKEDPRKLEDGLAIAVDVLSSATLQHLTTKEGPGDGSTGAFDDIFGEDMECLLIKVHAQDRVSSPTGQMVSHAAQIEFSSVL